MVTLSWTCLSLVFNILYWLLIFIVVKGSSLSLSLTVVWSADTVEVLKFASTPRAELTSEPAPTAADDEGLVASSSGLCI